MRNDIERLQQILKDNIYMTLATASKRSEPWITPLCFAFDDEFSIFWCSQKNAKHSLNIHENHRIAISVFNSSLQLEDNFPAIYIAGTAREVPDNELDYAIGIYDERMDNLSHRVRVNPENFFEGYPLRMYHAVPDDIYTLQPSALHYKEWIDSRIKVNFRSTL